MKAILLLNTGSPKTEKRQDVKSFIIEMLSDPKVITLPNLARTVLVKGIIAPFRQFTSSKRYSLIWDYTHKCSPLTFQTKTLAEKLELRTGMKVEFAMRYGEPSIKQAIESLTSRVKDLTEIIVLPLIPHYAHSSYKTAVDAVYDCYIENKCDFELKVIEPFFSHSCYIKALAESIRPYSSAQKIIFNFHSLPIKAVEKAWAKGKEFDYVFQTKETIRLVQKKLNLSDKQIRLCYSSAMGRNWLKPSLEETVKNLAKQGIKDVVVVSPGFITDNLETLYDIEIEAKDKFRKHGGLNFTYIHCLNSQSHWVNAIENMIR